MVVELLMRWKPDPVSADKFSSLVTSMLGSQEPGRTVSSAKLFYSQDAAPSSLEWYETQGVSASAPPAAMDGGMCLTLVRDVGDPSNTARWQYLVHTDIPDDVVAEYNEWYDNEHLPRLVGVTGIFRARRFVARTGSPRYLTAYDIAESATWETPEALTARKTPWTAKMRGLFHNTSRAFCELQVNHEI